MGKASGFRLQASGGAGISFAPGPFGFAAFVVRRAPAPDLVLDAHGARGGIGVTIEDGGSSEIGPATEGERLAGQALTPGFVNDHSHAFQRGLRGAVERIDPSRPHDDFWTWRERMYALAEGLVSRLRYARPAAVATRRCSPPGTRASPSSTTSTIALMERPTKTRTAWPRPWPWPPKMQGYGFYCSRSPTRGAASRASATHRAVVPATGR